VVSNIFIEHFEKLALDTAEQNHALELRHSGDTFVIWSDVLGSLQEFCNSIKFTLEIETDSVIPFLDVLVIREHRSLEKTHSHLPLPQFPEKRSCAESFPQSYCNLPRANAPIGRDCYSNTLPTA
jgi:hypothetical protein